REAGLALSWVGSGRLIFSLNYNDDLLNAVFERFVSACQSMQQAGWWQGPALLSNKAIRRSILKEMFARKAIA
ncbi:MAG: glutamate-1-semialdehyde 2,1-aminomutase, partial [Betaproteobacteria bacterium]|nr:glutamate-1-semialdehyde 2,1-aminomutase [Betaproteobacteria bacterium]